MLSRWVDISTLTPFSLVNNQPYNVTLPSQCSDDPKRRRGIVDQVKREEKIRTFDDYRVQRKGEVQVWREEELVWSLAQGQGCSPEKVDSQVHYLFLHIHTLVIAFMRMPVMCIHQVLSPFCFLLFYIRHQYTRWQCGASGIFYR